MIETNDKLTEMITVKWYLVTDVWGKFLGRKLLTEKQAQSLRDQGMTVELDD